MMRRIVIKAEDIYPEPHVYAGKWRVNICVGDIAFESSDGSYGKGGLTDMHIKTDEKKSI